MAKREKKIRIETGHRITVCDICEHYFCDPSESPCCFCRRTKNPYRFAEVIYINDIKYVPTEE